MSTTSQRTQLLSSAEHTLATARLGSDDYDVETYLQAVELVRVTGAAERYVDQVFGPDVEGVLRGVEQEDDDVARIEANLRRRGIVPSSASYEEYRAAAVEVGS